VNRIGSGGAVSIVGILQAQVLAKDQQLTAKDKQIEQLHVLLQQVQTVPRLLVPHGFQVCHRC
jgi:hypothetical protein